MVTALKSVQSLATGFGAVTPFPFPEGCQAKPDGVVAGDGRTISYRNASVISHGFAAAIPLPRRGGRRSLTGWFR
jgi:hypothetical protein